MYASSPDVFNSQPTPTLSSAATPAEDASPAASPTPRLPAAQPVLPPKRKLDLSLATLPQVGDLQPVQQIVVRELKGVNSPFTARMDHAVAFNGLVYQPPGEYETHFQILAGELLTDPRVMRIAKRIAFVPAYAWGTFEVVLMPLKMNTFGQRVSADLVKLQQRSPLYRAFVTWDPTRKRHVVFQETLNPADAELIGKVTWPSRDEVLEALEVTAFDVMGDLMAANEEVRKLVTTREVE